MKIGVTINHVYDPESDYTPDYSELRNKALAAEASGFDSIWVFDHLLFRHDPAKTVGIWECWTLLAALAEATERVELGTLVLCSPFRNPALLAKMAHTLDEVSGGRLILGLGAGWHQPEFDAFGYSFERRVDRFEEALQIVRPLLDGQSVDFTGDHYQAADCVIVPPGPRPDGIPLLVGAGKPRMLRLVARYADMWNTVWLGSPDELGERVSRIHAACAEVGRDPATLAITAGVEIAVPEAGETSPMTQAPLTGTVEEMATAIKGFEAGGVSHLMIHHTPPSLEAQAKVAEAVQFYRTI